MRALFLLMGSLALAGCRFASETVEVGGEGTGGENTTENPGTQSPGCTYKGTEYDVGDLWGDDEGCKSFKCVTTDSGQEVVEVPSVAICAEPGCEENGITYQVGEVWDMNADPGCTQFSECLEGGIIHSSLECVELSYCEYDGETYQVGDKWGYESGNSVEWCVTSCSCDVPGDDGAFAICDSVCTAVSTDCTYKGTAYDVGDSWFDDVECKQFNCVTTDSGYEVIEVPSPVVCAAAECSYYADSFGYGDTWTGIDNCSYECTSVAEDEVVVLGTGNCIAECVSEGPAVSTYLYLVENPNVDPDTCPDFVSAGTGCDQYPNTAIFADACGCGCVQSLDCPLFLDCMPPTSTTEAINCDNVSQLCPFTDVVF